MLRTLAPTEQYGVALGFIMKEQREAAARATVSTPSTPRVESLKLHVNSYVGREGERLLRWLVEVDTAITARRIVDPLSKVASAMSCLGERARSWACGRRLTDPTCFSTYEVFKEELSQAFEPPQNEFGSRAEFLDLQQSKHDVHAYAQRARYVVSNIVTNPIDQVTKVVTFMKGLKADGSQQRRGSTNIPCFRCGNNGHYARECTAPVQAAKTGVTIPGIATGNQKSRTTSRRGAPCW
ncbi:hypothetical protein PF005_g17577 [Phytophthora fragariae]|uniref:CCHC-type domain-containing protein n=1 Tax=Phytophthora fragariae TaxID=53985 RepID=A0A6A4A1P9_9STRA|nr:hypothetical protein PF003_g38248 [Phytophthora fragariae]KAE8943742.1 hypothetical protein PF009_g6530 [Phytophthora fragariae]KAE9007645.1 hypothetical protein PF011_g11042 [Phytophthora fragariae]KAE9069587.1 hypothetical protein PF007_g27260 [Phytophthora fragariae]KAE9109540.1 hypothetical protein PF010_g11504 [Phytophthora fragariae]